MERKFSSLRRKLSQGCPHYQAFLGCESQQTQKDLILTEQISGPVIYSYIWWLLQKAKELDCKRIYFLARDGYVLYHAAKQFCHRWQIDIDCRYLYCSRISLRIPSYFLSFEEACESIFSGGYRISPSVYLKRAGFTLEERKRIYHTLSFAWENEDKELSHREQKAFSELLRQSLLFRELLTQKSKAAFKTASGYLKQEGLFDGFPIFLADTGWLGSMQATLKKLCEANGCHVPFTGFYFGLYGQPEKETGGNYHSFYFSPQSSPFLKAKFNNNILECICTAPHGMTVAYTLDGTGYQPVLKPYRDNPARLKQLSCLQSYLERLHDAISPEKLSRQELFQISKALLQYAMYTPSLEIANYYGKMLFCDDASESYLNTLAQQVTPEQMRRYLIWNRLYYKFFKKELFQEEKDDLFWPYGTIVLSGLRPLWWYRLHLLLWELLRHFFKRY